MKKRRIGWLFIGVILLILLNVPTQYDDEIYRPPAYESRNTTGLAPSCGGPFDMCRFVDIDSGETRIPEKFQRAGRFYQDRAAVKVDNKWGYIDPEGIMVVPPQFSAADSFFNGHAQVIRDGRAGLIDQDGQIIIPFEYRSVIPFSFETAFIRTGEARGYKPNYIETRTSMFGLFSNEWAGLYDFEKGWLTSKNMQIKIFDRNNPNLFWAREPNDRKWGLMRADGSWKVEPAFDDVRQYSHGLAPIEVDNKKGAVNRYGQIVINPTFSRMQSHSYGFTVATKNNGQVGLFDAKGRLVDGRFFEKIGTPNSSIKYVAVLTKNGRWRKVTTSMQTVPDKGEIVASCDSGITIQAFMDKVVIRDAKGKAIGLPKFPPSYYSQDVCDAPIKIYVKGGIGYINHDGTYTPPLSRAETVRPAHKDDRRIYTTTERAKALKCENGNLLITNGKNWGMESAEGQLLVPVQYEALSCFEAGIAWASFRDKMAWCPIGIDGAISLMQPCRETYYPFLGYHSTPEQLHEDPFENSRLWNLAVLDFGAGQRDEPPTVKHHGPSR